MGQNCKIDSNPIVLIDILSRYGWDNFGATLFCLPIPKRQVDRDAWAWLRMMRGIGMARRRWMISADHAARVLKPTHPHLFTPAPVCFEVYRLPQKCLNKFFSRL